MNTLFELPGERRGVNNLGDTVLKLRFIYLNWRFSRLGSVFGGVWLAVIIVSIRILDV